MKNLHLLIKGRVQGVGFRYAAKNLARALKLSGYVKNLPDDSVFIEVEGEDDPVNEFTQWCHRGPERAVVKEVIVQEGALKNHSGFETRF